MSLAIISAQFGGNQQQDNEATLDAPILNVVSQSPLSLFINWSYITNATDYIYQISDTSDFSNPIQGTTANVYFEKTNNVPTQMLYFRARATGAGYLSSDWSEALEIIIDDLILLEDPNAVATNITPESVDISFDIDIDAKDYTIEISEDGVNYTPLASGLTSSPYPSTGLTGDTTYWWKVTAEANNINYQSSNSIVNETTSSTNELTPPLNFTLVNGISDNDWNATWGLAVNSDQCVIRIKELGGVYGSEIVVTGTSTVLDSLVNGTTYEVEYKSRDSNAIYTDSAPLVITKSKVSDITNSVPIEDFNVIGDGVFYWGTLTVTPLGNGTSRITKSGGTDFYSNMVGMQFVSARIHRNTSEFPTGSNSGSPTTQNYFPSVTSCRYSTVVAYEDASNVIVDLEYNGGNLTTPQATANTDGYFFTDNKEAFANCISDSDRPTDIILQDDKIYIIKGNKAGYLYSNVKFSHDGLGTKNPILMISMEDHFPCDEDGAVSNSQTFINDFGNPFAYGYIQNQDNNAGAIFDGIDVCGSIYVQKSVQYCLNMGSFFRGGHQKGRVNRIINSNILAVKELMVTALSTEREGASYCMPQFAAVTTGGEHDGTDITMYAEYGLYNTSWRAFQVHNLKSKYVSGVLFKAQGQAQNRANLIELKSVKATNFEDIPFSFSDNQTIVTNSPNFNFWMLANLYWSGGNTTSNNDAAALIIGGKTIYFGTLGTLQQILGEEVTTRPIINGSTAVMIDKIPVIGDIIPTGSGVEIQPKEADNIWNVIAWVVTIGDVLTYNGVDYTVVNSERKSRPNMFFTSTAKGWAFYYEITLDSGIVDLTATFTVKSSSTEYLLTGTHTGEFSYLRDLNGHLWYTDQQTNFDLENINFSGHWRATNEYDGGLELYKCVKTASFINCVSVNEDLEPTNWASTEYNPESLKTRYNAGDATAVVTISGGRMYWKRFTESYPIVHFSNRPHLLYGGGSLGEPRLLNPVSLDNAGFIIGAIGSNYIGATIQLTDGSTFNLSNSDLQADLKIIGDGTFIVDNLTTNPTTADPSRYSQIQLLNKITGVEQPTTLNTILSGAAGEAGISVGYAFAIGDIQITLTNWTLKAGSINPSGFRTKQLDGTDYCNYIDINGECLPSSYDGIA